MPPRATSEELSDLRSTSRSFIDPSNLFYMLDEIDDLDDEGYGPAYFTQDRIERRFQQRYELMLQRREMAEIYHTSHGHCNNRQTVLNLQAKGIECNHLKRYILAHRCDACEAAPGRRHHNCDLSIMTALTLTNPGAKSLFDLGVRCKPRSDTTRNMIAAFHIMMYGTSFAHHKRHQMTLRHQSKTLWELGATCDHLEIWLATPKAHQTPNITVRHCEAP